MVNPGASVGGYCGPANGGLGAGWAVSQTDREASGMEHLLFLCHRLPYPPDKGDKIRSYQWLRWLCARYRVHLGAFIDDPRDRQHIAAVEALCADTCIRPLRPFQRVGRSVIALSSGQSLTVACYRDSALKRWVRRTLADVPVRAALVYSSGMAQYLRGRRDLHRVMDFVDVDSDKWRQYATAHRSPRGLIYRCEANRLAAIETGVAADFDASVLVSEPEARFFREKIASAGGNVQAIANGVDSKYWNPERAYPRPYPRSEKVVVFVGAMDYRANADGALWFARSVWPAIRDRYPAARFYIVGARPSRAVRELAGEPGIVVTGWVEDVRPYLAHAHVVAAPLRIARGIQNKVLEALAMGKALVATPEAYEGIGRFDALWGCVSAAPDVQAAEANRWLAERAPAWHPDVRAYVLEHHGWQRPLEQLGRLLDAGWSSGSPEAVSVLRAREA